MRLNNRCRKWNRVSFTRQPLFIHGYKLIRRRLATAKALSASNARLALCDINIKGLESFNLDPKHHVYQLDVTSPSAISETVESIIQDFGGINHVFNCAGVNPTEHALTETTDEYWTKIVDTNMRGTYVMTRTVIPHLKAGSSIVNVSSIAGSRAMAGWAIYNASKFGVVGFSKSMALELGPKGIRVNVVAPGQIYTPTNINVKKGPEAVDSAAVLASAMGRFGTVEEVAAAVLFLMSGSASYVNGAVLDVDGGAK
jgi:NAD(P)-dependent dehydrogenase (short-subunit alcohol dehydrogenase family)